MSYFEDVNIRWQDTEDVDAFSRARVSSLTTLFDAKLLNDKLPLFIDEEVIGTGVATYNSNEASVALSVAASGDAVFMQTKRRFAYQGGKSQLIYFHFHSFDFETSITKRIGCFSSSTTTPFNASFDGFYLQSSPTTLSIQVYKTSTNKFNVIREDWDDPLDGNGQSGITHDFDNNTILVIDYQWGIGRMRWGIVKDGVIIPFHTLDSTETTGVFMSKSNKPLRWECKTSALVSATGFTFLSASIHSEGIQNQVTKMFSQNLGVSHINVDSTALIYSLIGIRLQSAKVGIQINLQSFSVVSKTSDMQLVQLWLNPIVAGTFTYYTKPNSSVQIATGSSFGTANTITGGTLLFSQYINVDIATEIPIETAFKLGQKINGTLDTIVLSSRTLTANADVLGSINWTEIL